MKKYLIVVSFLVGMTYVLANGVFAILYPERWLKASWTATRGMDPETLPRTVRIHGVMNLAIAAVLGVIVVNFLWF
jgi:hypothetical protein